MKIKTMCGCYLAENFWLADSTKDTTKRAFGYLADCVGNKELDKVGLSDGEFFKGWLLKTGRSKTTANIYMRSLGPVFNWAAGTKKLMPENPLKGLRQFKTTRSPVRIYEDWQVQRMLRYANLKWQGIILTAWTTGLRRGAILNLTVDNVRNGYIYVEPKRDTLRTWWWEPKDKEVRKVPVTDDVCMIIGSLGGLYPFISEKTYERMISDSIKGLLSGYQRRCPDWNFRRDFVAIQRKAFGRQIGDFHSLRKTYTTRMCEVLPDHFVMRLTGHNSLKTMTYYLASRESYYDYARQKAQEGIKMGPLEGEKALGHKKDKWAVVDSND